MTTIDEKLLLNDIKIAIDELGGIVANIDNRDENSSILIRQNHETIHKMQNVLVQMNSKQLALEVALQNSKIQERLIALETAALSIAGISKRSDLPTPNPSKLDDDYPKLLETQYPEIFPLWLQLFNASLPFYEKSVEASCSTWDNQFAVAFRDYVQIFAKGNLLDVGSGTLAKPVYLEGYPVDLLYGLDPREPEAAPDFAIAQGVNEFLPWQDGSFQSVCNATSLDHVLDLERSLAETARVLCNNGRFVLWYANINGAPPPPKSATNADTGKSSNIDDFHLFHINDEWFLPKMKRHFELLDRRVYPSSGFDHVFAVYEKF